MKQILSARTGINERQNWGRTSPSPPYLGVSGQNPNNRFPVMRGHNIALRNRCRRRRVILTFPNPALRAFFSGASSGADWFSAVSVGHPKISFQWKPMGVFRGGSDRVTECNCLLTGATSVRNWPRCKLGFRVIGVSRSPFVLEVVRRGSQLKYRARINPPQDSVFR